MRVNFKKTILVFVAAAMIFACERKPKDKVANGQDENVYKKLSLTADVYTKDNMPNEVAQFYYAVGDESVESFKFEIGLNFMHMLIQEKDGSFTPKYHWKLSHYDYDNARNNDGEENQFLVLSTLVNQDPHKRALIQANPQEVLSKSADENPYRFAVRNLKNQTFVVGKDNVPGLNDVVSFNLTTNSGVADGDKLDVYLDLENYRMFKGDQEVLRMNLEYYDLVVKRDPATGEWKLKEEKDTERPWDLREYVEIKIDSVDYSPEDQNIYYKSDFATPGSSIRQLFVEAASKQIGQDIDEAEVQFLVDETKLQLLTKDGTPLGQWKIEKHSDYDQGKNSRDESFLQGYLNEKLNDDWRDRSVIQVDPLVFSTKDIVMTYNQHLVVDFGGGTLNLILPSPDSKTQPELAGRIAYMKEMLQDPETTKLRKQQMIDGYKQDIGVFVESLTDPVIPELPGLTKNILYLLLTGEGRPGEPIQAFPGGNIRVRLTGSMLVIEAVIEDGEKKTFKDLLNFPAEYFDLVVKTDPATGYLKDKKEKDTEKKWNEREYVQVDYERPNFDPIEIRELENVYALNSFLDELKEETDPRYNEFIYVPSVVDAPRQLAVSIPHYQGLEKIVKFKATETALQVYELDIEEGLNDNETNNHPVMSIPISRFDYRCPRDQSGECSGGFQRVTDRDWREREYLEADFANTNIKEVNILPLMLDTYLMPGCFDVKEQRIVDFEKEDDALNIIVERDYIGRIGCLNFDSLSDLGFTVKYHYSFVRLNKMASPDYEPIQYPRRDENTFGFFNTAQTLLDHSNRQLQKNEEVFMHRWNPNRKVITYYPNNDFKKPENKVFHDATVRSFEIMNQGLEKADIPFRLEFKQLDYSDPVKLAETRLPDAGDIRKNMIMLVDDPGKYGLLGYGPSVANPRTGELMNARTVMYGGIFKLVVKSAYEEVYRLRDRVRNDQLGKAITSFTEDNMPLAGSDLFSGANSRFPELRQWAFELDAIDPSAVVGESNVENSAEFVADLDFSEVKEPGIEIEKYGIQYLLEARQKMLDAMSEEEDLTNEIDMDRIDLLSRNNAYAVEMFNLYDDLRDKIIEAAGGKDNMKPWAELSDAQQKKILDEVLPVIYIGTLVHEIGHNLGLRHNFNGSEDISNFYSADESLLGEATESSSIMEYQARETTSLLEWGKYDLAALRFGYNREVELIGGRMAKVKTTLEEMNGSLKEYMYCSDEGVALNPTCNRHDIGVGYEGIAEGIYTLYKERYESRSKRNGLLDFSLFDDFGYARRIDGTFRSLRLFYESRERIFHEFSDFGFRQWMDETMLPEGFLKELELGMNKGFDQLLEVLLTPSQMCLIANNRGQLMGVEPLADIGLRFNTCDEVDRYRGQEGVVPFATGGKRFKSWRDPNNPNIYVDQIDERGYWMDKLLAAKWLLKQRLGYTFDKSITGNYFILEGERADRLKKALFDILLDYVTTDTEFVNNQGEEFKAKVTYSPYVSHRIPSHMSWAMRWYMKLPEDGSHFAAELLKTIKRELNSQDNVVRSLKWTNAFKAHSYVPTGRQNEEVVSTKIHGYPIFAFPENELAIMAINALNQFRALDAFIEKYGVEEANSVYNTDGQRLRLLIQSGDKEGALAYFQNLSDDEKSIVNLDRQVFVADTEKKIQYYEDLLIRLL